MEVFAPAQWVLSCLPRSLVGDECIDMGALQAHADGPTTFCVQSRFRAKAREALARWDCSERVTRAALREAAPVVGSYQVGDIGLQWSVGSRLIGFEKNKNSLSNTQPRTCWVIFDSVPVCVVIDRVRPCSPTELLAFHYTQNKSSSPLAADVQTQDGFIDERASPHNPTLADPSRTADDDLDEDERDHGMSEPTQMTSAGKRKADETAKWSRAL